MHSYVNIGINTSAPGCLENIFIKLFSSKGKIASKMPLWAFGGGGWWRLNRGVLLLLLLHGCHGAQGEVLFHHPLPPVTRPSRGRWCGGRWGGQVGRAPGTERKGRALRNRTQHNNTNNC